MLLRNQRIQSDPGSERELRAVEIRRHSRANAFNVFLFSEGPLPYGWSLSAEEEEKNKSDNLQSKAWISRQCNLFDTHPLSSAAFPGKPKKLCRCSSEFLVTLSPFNSEYQLLKFSDDGALFSCGMQWIPSHSAVVLRLGTVILRSYSSLYLVPASLEPGAVDHPDTLPLSYMQKKRERKMDQHLVSPQAPPHLLISSLTVSWVEMGYDRVGNAQVLCLFVTVENLLPLFSWSTVLFRELVLSPLDRYNSQYIDVSTSSLLLLWFMQQ
ncbi:hypothetical protein MG293_006856 [Ovis ammon polii]|uniref:Uncharacterized protein n=1 Tax=Ovis ammon polii TaxID=230172 RepID=A0AAD4UER6_OVIAM|nr:hypothetical protein MG293_006856 [Ovis ammon polii]